jgi:8-oxo-dGTP diphosphatase
MLPPGALVVQTSTDYSAIKPAPRVSTRAADAHGSSLAFTLRVAFSMNTKHPSLAVDCVVFDPAGRLLLIRRKHPPFPGRYALPGGYLEYGETTEHAAARELNEETGLIATNLSLIGVYSDPHRDPRGHIVSIAYRIDVVGHDPLAGDDAADAAFIADWEHLDLAFDHRNIVDDAVRKGSKPA